MEKVLSYSFFRNWFRIAVFNLLLVSALGVLMRYKIAFSLPFVNQKYVLNAHSHFAFAGWITQALMIFIAFYISQQSRSFSVKKYNYLLFANLLTAYGMLFSFPFQGYALISIIFSTLSLFVSYAFAIVVWRDLNRTSGKSILHYWIKAALIFSVLSSVGPYTLAYTMVSSHVLQKLHLASIYFFLHFQYNGWFFFACMGLFMTKIATTVISYKIQKIIFFLFAFACVPAYFLSALWLPVPLWLYVLVIMAAFAQVIGWSIFLIKTTKNFPAILPEIKPAIKFLFCLSAIAMSIKLFLQLASVIPTLSAWAFGFRPIIIGYLHLVFLGVFSLFILGYALSYGYLKFNKKIINAICIFVSGIFLNEVFLLAEGLSAVAYNIVPYVKEWLLAAAGTLFIGLLMLNISLQKKEI